MIPQYKKLSESSNSLGEPLVTISFGKLALAVVSLPLFSFIFCIVWSIIFFFEQSTSTHCHVFNMLPSISAAIGNYQPQRFVWQLAIILHIIPRFVVAYMYSQYYSRIIRKKHRVISTFAILLNVIELNALLGLTLWTSVDSYDTHKTCFGYFIAASEIYMFLTYLLNKNCRREPVKTIEAKSLKYKRNLFIINVTSFALAGYFFFRHNTLCEPGVYSMFSFFEYIVVFTNMGYHSTAYWDFSDRNLCFDFKRGIHFTYT